MKPVLVTSYVNPDLDGVACATAYAHMLQENGRTAEAKFFGAPLGEVVFASKEASTSIKPITDSSAYDEIIIVDVSRMHDLDPSIDPLKVIEVIDHRSIIEAEPFKNARIQIELVASCATLVTERIKASGQNPSRGDALLLYTAIISNSLNFRTPMTTDRDRAMAQWLENIAKPPANYLHDFYLAKSEIHLPLTDHLDADFTDYTFGGKKTGIAQLEMIDMKKYFMQHLQEFVETLNTLKQRYALDYMLFNGADPEAGTSFIFCDDLVAQQHLSRALDVTFTENFAYPSTLLMRKQISSKLKAELEHK